MNKKNSKSQREFYHSAKLIQVTELNNRARTYSTKFWQIPFAYIGLTGLALINVSKKYPSHLDIVLVGSIIFGILIFLSMLSIRKAIEDAREAIEKLEIELNIAKDKDDSTAKKRPLIIWANLLIIILSVIFYGCLFCRGIS